MSGKYINDWNARFPYEEFDLNHLWYITLKILTTNHRVLVYFQSTEFGSSFECKHYYNLCDILLFWRCIKSPSCTEFQLTISRFYRTSCKACYNYTNHHFYPAYYLSTRTIASAPSAHLWHISVTNTDITSEQSYESESTSLSVEADIDRGTEWTDSTAVAEDLKHTTTAAAERAAATTTAGQNSWNIAYR